MVNAFVGSHSLDPSSLRCLYSETAVEIPYRLGRDKTFSMMHLDLCT